MDFSLLHPGISKHLATIKCCLLIPATQMWTLRSQRLEDTILIRFFFLNKWGFYQLQWELNWVSYDWITENVFHREK